MGYCERKGRNKQGESESEKLACDERTEGR